MRSGINDSVPRFTAHLKSATHVNSGESETTALGIYVVAIYRLGKTAVKDATSMAIAFVALPTMRLLLCGALAGILARSEFVNLIRELI